MNTLKAMLGQHPRPAEIAGATFAETLSALGLCHQICLACADACLGESGSADRLRRCIGLNLDCAAVCAATLALATRQTETAPAVVHAQLHACALVCQACSEECGKHASMHAHCATCSDVCRRCQAQCNQLLGEISDAGVVPEVVER